MWDLLDMPKPTLTRSQINPETMFGRKPRYDVQHNGRGQWIAREVDAEPGDPFGTGPTMDDAIHDLLEVLADETP